jgi:hypothetical protein
VDVQASVSGASFAVCSSGVAYRWGYNQVEETQFPILDRFGSIINYSSAPLYFKSAHPAALKYLFPHSESIISLAASPRSRPAVVSSSPLTRRDYSTGGASAGSLAWQNSRTVRKTQWLIS